MHNFNVFLIYYIITAMHVVSFLFLLENLASGPFLLRGLAKDLQFFSARFSWDSCCPFCKSRSVCAYCCGYVYEDHIARTKSNIYFWILCLPLFLFLLGFLLFLFAWLSIRSKSFTFAPIKMMPATCPGSPYMGTILP